MNIARKTDHRPPQDYPFTPSLDGFERRLRAWVRLPAKEVTTPDAGGEASAPPKEQGAS